MRYLTMTLASGALLLSACATDTTTVDEKAVDMAKAESTELCTDMGPQTPRDIASLSGKNLMEFAMAPAATEMNLCNIHTHTNAEH